MAIQRDPNKVIKKLSVGNNYGHTATDYVGGTDDLWFDDNDFNIIRRGDGPNTWWCNNWWRRFRVLMTKGPLQDHAGATGSGVRWRKWCRWCRWCRWCNRWRPSNQGDTDQAPIRRRRSGPLLQGGPCHKVILVTRVKVPRNWSAGWRRSTVRCPSRCKGHGINVRGINKI